MKEANQKERIATGSTNDAPTISYNRRIYELRTGETLPASRNGLTGY